MLSTTGLLSDMQKIADKIKRDVESQLNEAFRTFEVIEDMTPKMQDEKNMCCRMMIKTDDNGHVKVKTMRKDPGSDWKVEVEEYDRGNKAMESGSQMKSLGMQDSFCKDMQRMSSKIKRDVERQLNRAFKTFDVMENRMMIRTDDGQIQVRAMQDEPSSELKVTVEDQTKGKKSMEGMKSMESGTMQQGSMQKGGIQPMGMQSGSMQTGSMQTGSMQTGSMQTGSMQKGMMMQQESIMKDMQCMANKIKQMVEKQLNQVFKTFEAMENRMMIKTDGNGQVQVKTTQCEPDAKIEVEDFKRGDMPMEGSKEASQQKTMVQ